MTFIEIIPALVKIALVFTVIILAIRKEISLATAFLAGGLILSLLFLLTPDKIALSVFACVIQPKVIALCIIIGQILIFSSSLETTGQLHRLLGTFQGLMKNPRVNLTLFPLLIGLLPMPGGAIFSAPMVKEVGNRSNLTPAGLSYINYWFRHIWEYWWPMYPGVLLATMLADIKLELFMAMMLPFTLLVIRIGWLPLRDVQLVGVENSEKTTEKKSARPFFKEIFPILLVITAGLGLGWLMSYLFPDLTVAKELGLIVSLCAGIALVWRTNRLPAAKCRAIMTTPQVIKMIYMVLAILIFKQLLEDSGAVSQISDELIRLGIPLLMICVVLPFIVGVLTGITIAFVGSAFPILISLIISDHSEPAMIGYMMVALSCGFAGVILSPVHLCLLLSNEFFGTSLRSVYKLLWFPCVGIVTASLLYFMVLCHLMGWNTL